MQRTSLHNVKSNAKIHKIFHIQKEFTLLISKLSFCYIVYTTKNNIKNQLKTITTYDIYIAPITISYRCVGAFFV